MDASRSTPGRSPGVVGYLNMNVKDLVRLVRSRGASEAGPGRAEQAALSREGHLRLVSEAGRLDFYSTLASERLFSVRGHLAGSLGTFVEGDGGKGRRVVLSAPLELPGLGRRSLKITFQGPPGGEPGEGLQLTRAGEGRLPPRSRLLEFLFTQGEQEYRYVVEIDADVPVEGFREVADTRPLFRSIPPVAQMTAFLRAITQQRRNALRILADLASSSGSPATRATVALMERLFRGHYEFGGPVLEGVRRLLLSQDISVSPAVLAATCLFFDLERGALTPALLEEAAQNQEDPPCSPEAGLACALRFGARV
ncbi:MAG TPA: hypothetical protein VNO81_00285, partial [Candidatus Nitrosotenuis sp.]|nr:hypothetical protein [Candidatus Nitrosotenuis sp.]